MTMAGFWLLILFLTSPATAKFRLPSTFSFLGPFLAPLNELGNDHGFTPGAHDDDLAWSPAPARVAARGSIATVAVTGQQTAGQRWEGWVTARLEDILSSSSSKKKKKKKKECRLLRIEGSVAEAYLSSTGSRRRLRIQASSIIQDDQEIVLRTNKAYSLVLRVTSPGMPQVAAKVTLGRCRGGGHEKNSPPPVVTRIPLSFDDWNKGHDWPDLIDGHLFGELIQQPVRNIAGKEWLRELRLHVLETDVLEETVGPAFDVAPGQMLPLYAPLRLRPGSAPVPFERCPIKVHLRVTWGAGGKSGATGALDVTSVKLRCRRGADEAVTFLYLDVDRSPQVAAFRVPPATSACRRSEVGCPVILSTHGMDVTAQRQADAYRVFPDAPAAWVLAPLGRSTGGMNWQGIGHRSASAALEALADLSKRWARAASVENRAIANPAQLIFTGHSNGGFGALMFASHFPDSALAAAPLAGMTALGQSLPRKPSFPIPKALREIFDASIAEYRGEETVANLHGVPVLIRTGSLDRVIDPRSSQYMHQLVQRKANCSGSWRPGRAITGQDCRLSVVQGKEHWWWDTDSENDGGAVFDPEIRSFFTEAIKRAERLSSQTVLLPATLGKRFSIVCWNPATCGTRGGIQIQQLLVPFLPATFSVEKREGQEIHVETENVGRLSIQDSSWLSSTTTHRLIIDGSPPIILSPALLEAIEGRNEFVHLCTNDRASSHGWRMCRGSDDADTCTTALEKEGGKAQGDTRNCAASTSLEAGGERGPMTTGPLRQIYESPILIIIGSAQQHLDAAVRLANGWYTTARGLVRIARFADLCSGDDGGKHQHHQHHQHHQQQRAECIEPESYNLVLLGGPDDSAVFALALKNPLGSGREYRVGPSCHIRWSAGMGAITLAPSSSSSRLAAIVHGVDELGFDKAMRVFEGGLFEVNNWQLLAPDFIVLSTRFGQRGWSGVAAAGFWDRGWKFQEKRTYLAPGVCSHRTTPS